MDNITEFNSIKAGSFNGNADKPRRGRPKKNKGPTFDTIDVTKLSDLDDKGKKKPILRAGKMESGERLYLSEKHEQYCRYRADSYTPQRAYALIYPLSSSPGTSAAALEKKEEIIERIRQLQLERASMAKLVDPQESLVRWNEIFLKAQEEGDISTAIIAQKQIDKINGAETAMMKQQLEVKGLFRGDSEEEWVKNAKNLFQALFESNIIDRNNPFIKEKEAEKAKEEAELQAKLKRKEEIILEKEEKARFEESIPKVFSPSASMELMKRKLTSDED